MRLLGLWLLLCISAAAASAPSTKVTPPEKEDKTLELEHKSLASAPADGGTCVGDTCGADSVDGFIPIDSVDGFIPVDAVGDSVGPISPTDVPDTPHEHVLAGCALPKHIPLEHPHTHNSH